MIASVREVTVIASAIGPHVPNLGAVVTLFGVDGLLLFLMVFHHKSMVRSSYMMITIFIYCYRDPMSQIWVQWSHFSALMGYCCFLWCFITKVCSGLVALMGLLVCV